jgi:hypothetical protein
MIEENNKLRNDGAAARFSVTKIFNPIKEKLKEKREKQNETKIN